MFAGFCSRAGEKPCVFPTWAERIRADGETPSGNDLKWKGAQTQYYYLLPWLRYMVLQNQSHSVTNVWFLNEFGRYWLMFLNTVMATGTCMPTEQVHKMSIHNPPSIICTCMPQNSKPDPCLRSVMRSMGKDTPGLLMPTGITSPSLTLASICMACTSVNERYHKLGGWNKCGSWRYRPILCFQIELQSVHVM